MEILLDGCVPRPFGRALPEHSVAHVSDLGWDDLDDGPLLDRAGGRFAVLITTDRSMPHQQRMRGRALVLIVLRARTNRLQDLLPLIPALRATLETTPPGEVRVLSA